MSNIEREIPIDFYKRLLYRLDSINENLKEINATLKRFGNYIPEPTHPDMVVGVE
jgi:hypothetical protein